MRKLPPYLSGYLILFFLLGGCQSGATQSVVTKEEAAERTAKGRALFEEKCRTVAGEKIYRIVNDVEGIALLRIRPQAGESDWSNQMWPGAAFAREWSGKEYIQSFLGYEYAPGQGLTGKPGVITPQRRGYINTQQRPDGLPGYQFVEVVDEKDGQRYRYALVGKPGVGTQGGRVDTELEREITTSSRPQYGVTFEDHVISDERELGLASSTVKVLDLQTGEVLGEMTRYAWSAGGPSSGNPNPWLRAYRCPPVGVGADTVTRKFVDQVLVPRRGK